MVYPAKIFPQMVPYICKFFHIGYRIGNCVKLLADPIKLLGSTSVLLIKFLGGFSGGQEAIPYTNTEVST